jgi:hypothetical protein
VVHGQGARTESRSSTSSGWSVNNERMMVLALSIGRWSVPKCPFGTYFVLAYLIMSFLTARASVLGAVL